MVVGYSHNSKLPTAGLVLKLLSLGARLSGGNLRNVNKLSNLYEEPFNNAVTFFPLNTLTKNIVNENRNSRNCLMALSKKLKT